MKSIEISIILIALIKKHQKWIKIIKKQYKNYKKIKNLIFGTKFEKIKILTKYEKTILQNLWKIQNSTGVILIKICSKIIFWRPKSCFKRLNPNQNIKNSPLKNLRPKFESKNLNPDFDLTQFQSPDSPFDITNR